MTDEVKNGYLSGQMSGIDGYNFPEFHRNTEMLRETGWHIFNPAEFDGVADPKFTDEDLRWRYFLTRDVRILMDLNLTHILFLPGWQKSRGARLEAIIGMELMGLRGAQIVESQRGFALMPLKITHFGIEAVMSYPDCVRKTHKNDQLIVG